MNDRLNVSMRNNGNLNFTHATEMVTRALKALGVNSLFVEGRGRILPSASHRKAKWQGVVTLLAVVLVACVAQTSAGHAILRKAGLFEESASYTSLAFVHPQSLPEQLGAKRANVGVSFEIHNVSGASRDYRWSVLMVQGGNTHRVATGSVLVASGGGVSITRAVKVFCVRGQTQIVVSLVYPAEHIDAWMECRPGRN
jgi:hypothetical protein